MSASCCPFYISRPIIDFYYLSKEKFLQLIAIYTVSSSLTLRIHAATETAEDGSVISSTDLGISANITQLCNGKRR